MQKVTDFDGRVWAKSWILSVGIWKSGGTAVGLGKSWATPGFQKVAGFVGQAWAKSRILSVGTNKSGGSALGAANNVGYSRVAKSAEF